MKKLTWALIVGSFLVANFYCEYQDLHIPQVTRVSQAITNDSQEELDKKKESKRIQDQIIIRDKINRVGKLTVLEGSYVYKNKIADSVFNFTIREMTLDFVYKISIGIDTADIDVVKIENDTVYIDIPKDKLQLQYIELRPESKIIDDNKIIFASDFKPSEVEQLLEESQYNVTGKINGDEQLFDQALDNLKRELKELTQTLGYIDIVFEVI